VVSATQLSGELGQAVVAGEQGGLVVGDRYESRRVGGPGGGPVDEVDDLAQTGCGRDAGDARPRHERETTQDISTAFGCRG